MVPDGLFKPYTSRANPVLKLEGALWPVWAVEVQVLSSASPEAAWLGGFRH
jgi:hypothetical protein